MICAGFAFHRMPPAKAAFFFGAFDVRQAGIFGAMNYRHAFHAGNFADVVKHAILSRLVVHLRKKDSAFRVIDTHAGAGLYDLTGPEAVRSPEWRDGIGRILGADLDPAAMPLLTDYLEAVRAANPPGKITRYPGSPLLVRAWLRRADRMVACELEPSAAKALAQTLHGERRAKVVAIDGWTALSAYIPPRERRGLVLIDPPYEQPDEFSRLAAALCAALDKWPTGVFFAWYPIKDREPDRGFAARFTGAEDVKHVTCGIHGVVFTGRHETARQRAVDRQPALDTGARSQNPAAGFGENTCTRRQRRRPARLACSQKLVWRFRSPHHSCREFVMRTSEPKPH